MNTNHNGHTLRNLTNRVMAVIDDAEQARAVVETLEQVGIPERELAALSGTEGARRIDADGIHSRGVTQALRALQGLTVEGDHLRHYEAELARGHLVVEVAARSRRKRDAIVRVLRRHGAHFINAYGQWTIERVAA